MALRDVLPALGCGALAVATFVAVPLLDDGSAEVVTPGRPGWWVVLATLVVQAVLLLGVRRSPRAVVVAVAALGTVAAAVGAGDATSVAFLAVVVATYVAGTTHPLRELLPALVATAVLVATASGLGARWAGDPAAVAAAGALVQAVGTLGLTLLVAVVVATRRESVRARRAELDAERREQQALVQAAIARERTAMARELHDIAAHHLSGIAVMTAAIGSQIDTDPAAAKLAVRQVREQSTAVLRDLRSLVGLLRDDGGTPAADTRPETIAGIADLVADAVAAGREVSLSVLSDRPKVGDGVGPLAQLACYRAVQEALANAARHAPGAPCEVLVDDRSDDAAVVTVRNGPTSAVPEPGARGGYGLIGMRERAELTGGSVETGATDDGGWRVVVRAPREEAPREEQP